MADKKNETVNIETGEVVDTASVPNANEKGNGFEPRQIITFDPHMPENRVRMFNARNSAVSLKNIGDTPINIVDVMTQIGSRARSGNPCQNTYIFADDGQVYFTQSNGLGRTVNELVEMVEGDFKANTTNGYVKVQIKEIALSGDRTYKRFVLIEA